ncbi:MAG TPA: hypothetical protein VJH22_07680 [Candidatus Nanoarchaeia archaeon]|nr:hypothetical protein [Candidatus Nanoarchaeia archaeon]
MAKRMVMSSAAACSSCGPSSCGCKAMALIVLLVGVIFLLQDLGALARWGLNWPLSWWTVAFLLLGLKKLMISMRS